MTLSDWKSSGEYFEFKGQNIFFQTKGNGETLVLLHGFPTSSWDWEKIWLPLSEKYRLIAPDFLGFGFSDKPIDHQYSIFEQADLVEALLKNQNIESYHLLVHDYAVSVGQELLYRTTNNKNYRFPVKSIGFLNGGIFPEQHHPLVIQRLLNSPVGFLVSKLNSKKILQKNLDKVFGTYKATEREIEDFWTCITYNNGNKLMHKLIHYISDRTKYRDRLVNGLVDFKDPKILINGALDPVSGIHAANYYKSK
jgi:pimeloyl-ACP methyl ester carboxylesterase